MTTDDGRELVSSLNKELFLFHLGGRQWVVKEGE